MRILILINQTKLLELVAQGVCVDNAQGEGGLGGELKIGLASKVYSHQTSHLVGEKYIHLIICSA